MKKMPMRRCVVTGEVLPKSQLLRVVRTPEGEIKVDLTGKLNGRGAYLKKSQEILMLAHKKGALQKNLNCDISDEIYARIAKEIDEQ